MRTIITVLNKIEYLEREKDLVIKRILSDIELIEGYKGLSSQDKYKIRNKILDELNTYSRLVSGILDKTINFQQE